MMSTGLNLAQSSVENAILSANQNPNSTLKFSLKTFAELTHEDQISVVKSWLDETEDDMPFAGEVKFGVDNSAGPICRTEHTIVVCENRSWKVAVAAGHNTSAFSTVLMAKHAQRSISALKQDEISSLANIIAIISTRYDNLMMASVGLSIEWLSNKSNQLFAVISPIVSNDPGRFGSQRFVFSEFTPMQTARRLSNLSDIHFRDIFPE